MSFLKASDPRGKSLFSAGVVVGSLGWTGFAPVMRGTSGSIATALVAWGLLFAPGGVSVWWIATVATCALSLWAGSAVLREFRRDDPGWFVMDEAAGLFLTLALIGADSLLAIAWALLIFRVYDIAKPWPVKPFERLDGTVGILADDLAAGALAAWTYLLMLEIVGTDLAATLFGS